MPRRRSDIGRRSRRAEEMQRLIANQTKNGHQRTSEKRKNGSNTSSHLI